MYYDDAQKAESIKKNMPSCHQCP